MHVRDNMFFEPREFEVTELVSHNKAWWHAAPNKEEITTTPLHYTFSLPENPRGLLYENAITLLPLYRAQIEKSLALWGSYSKMNFIEINPPYDTDMPVPDIRIYQVGLVNEGQTCGLTQMSVAWNERLYAAYIYLSSECRLFETPDDPILFKYIAAHEIGHGVGLMHPFETLKHFFLYDPSQLLPMAERASTLFSVMNYEFERDINNNRSKRIVPTSPMLHDIEVLQKMYGINTRAGLGDDIYDVSEYVTTSPEYTSISCLPWDNGGIDTFSLPDSYNVQGKRVTINLNPYGVSNLHGGYIIMPNIAMENFVGGKLAHVDITLNKENNIIDLRKTASATVRTDLRNAGHDTIWGLGANHTNTLVLLEGTIDSSDIERRCVRISTTTLPPTHVADTLLPECSGTRIEFGKCEGYNSSHSITLCDVTPKELDKMLRTDYLFFSDYVNKVFADFEANTVESLTTELISNFNQAVKNSIMFTLVISLMEESLSKCNFNKRQIEFIKNTLVMPLLALINGNLVATVASTGFSSLLKYFNFSDYTCMAIGSLVYNGERLGEMLTPWGFAKFCATSAGSLCGSTLTVFAKNKVKKNFSLQQPSERTALTESSDDKILPLVMKSKSVISSEPPKKEELQVLDSTCLPKIPMLPPKLGATIKPAYTRTSTCSAFFNRRTGMMAVGAIAGALTGGIGLAVAGAAAGFASEMVIDVAKDAGENRMSIQR